MTTNDKLADAPITHDEAAEAVSSMDDFAKMDTSVDPFGPRATLERYIAQQRATSLAAPPAQGEWAQGAPSKPWSEEWFIAVTTSGDRVVLRALPESYTYDFTTADETHIKRDRIAKWMQFPDSEFIAPQPAPAPVQVDGWCSACGCGSDAAGYAHLSGCINAQPPAPGDAELPPIERDEAYDRDYIPLPGGWEVQTKGSGSTFRICDTKSGERMPVVETMLHPWLERMAREVRAAIAALAQQRVPDAVRELSRLPLPSQSASKGNAESVAQQPGAQAVGYVSPHVVEHQRAGGLSATTITPHRAMLVDDVPHYTDPPPLPEGVSDADKALAYYRAGLEHGVPAYVPARIRLQRGVRGDPPIGHATSAPAGDYDCECNRYGAVSVRATSGKMLGIKPAEFEVLEWRENDRARLAAKAGGDRAG